MFFKPKKTGINFLCDAIILPQYYNFEREFEHKYPNFKNITFDSWNLFISVYFTTVIQKPLQQMSDWEYIKLMGKTVDYFETQYPMFRKVLHSLLNDTSVGNSDEIEYSVWLAGNLFQTTKEKLTIEDIKMVEEIAETIKYLASVADMDEVKAF